ncbi:hypothetical protein BU16DRAFT_607212 [Lophium mytilinum]|uniref:Uncharacterized protein n=1 Tax=Lophium mytilinum TaxID=390894 RepID=A0A6A6QZM5_9PEZI|nr:hypothetical protein BU16DRAFT_607212 [Lophium mytilinum]
MAPKRSFGEVEELLPSEQVRKKSRLSDQGTRMEIPSQGRALQAISINIPTSIRAHATQAEPIEKNISQLYNTRFSSAHSTNENEVDEHEEGRTGYRTELKDQSQVYHEQMDPGYLHTQRLGPSQMLNTAASSHTATNSNMVASMHHGLDSTEVQGAIPTGTFQTTASSRTDPAAHTDPAIQHAPISLTTLASKTAASVFPPFANRFADLDEARRWRRDNICRLPWIPCTDDPTIVEIEADRLKIVNLFYQGMTDQSDVKDNPTSKGREHFVQKPYFTKEKMVCEDVLKGDTGDKVIKQFVNTPIEWRRRKESNRKNNNNRKAPKEDKPRQTYVEPDMTQEYGEAAALGIRSFAAYIGHPTQAQSTMLPPLQTAAPLVHPNTNNPTLQLVPRNGLGSGAASIVTSTHNVDHFGNSVATIIPTIAAQPVGMNAQAEENLATPTILAPQTQKASEPPPKPRAKKLHPQSSTPFENDVSIGNAPILRRDSPIDIDSPSATRNIPHGKAQHQSAAPAVSPLTYLANIQPASIQATNIQPASIQTTNIQPALGLNQPYSPVIAHPVDPVANTSEAAGWDTPPGCVDYIWFPENSVAPSDEIQDNAYLPETSAGVNPDFWNEFLREPTAAPDYSIFNDLGDFGSSNLYDMEEEL